MSGLRSALDEVQPSRGGVQCSVCHVLGALDADDSAALQEALDSHLFRGTNISEALGKIGWKVSAGSVQRHRRNQRTGH